MFPTAVGRRGASMLTPYYRPEGGHYAGFEKKLGRAADSDIPGGPRRSLRSRAGRVNCDGMATLVTRGEKKYVDP